MLILRVKSVVTVPRVEEGAATQRNMKHLLTAWSQKPISNASHCGIIGIMQPIRILQPRDILGIHLS